MQPLYLIDASVYIFRAWFAIDESLRDDAGDPANAVYGYGNFLLDLLQDGTLRHALAAFDASLATCFRNDIYPAYKANRPQAPEDLKRQIDICRSLTRALGLAAASSDRYEADDLIGTAASRFRCHGFTMRYLTSDKDYAQLLQPGDRIVDVSGRRNLDCDGVRDSLGVRADQVADLLGLAGDGVDNIPGVPGIGPRTACALLDAFGSLEDIYAGLDRIPGLPLRGGERFRQLLIRHRDQAFLSRELATIHCSAPLEADAESIAVRPVRGDAVADLPLPERVRRRARALIDQGVTDAVADH
ncbi:5'-3' exonuclease H3TH domain-containing protein [Aquisalimonas lutea]|uniref:5'-3' exonuclease n=1 Tax=Aquisalimonas lutea TaxID=1327750 RepID=UPI0025B49A4F|nr:5'-3' exonuclease H3TH domain-containing protein [Aquisalimonas lutea]MDN3516768.1 5'-3' exonuclease H3TH domain-containing protein [Aquisalimonas lutea]